MRNQIVTRGLPTLMVLMAVAVILILAGAGTAGLVFGLVVAGSAGIVLVSMMFYEVASDERDRTRRDRLHRRPQAKAF